MYQLRVCMYQQKLTFSSSFQNQKHQYKQTTGSKKNHSE